MKILEVKNLTVKSDNQKILDNISFELEEKDFLGIIGPNGAGKSTLLKAILGLIDYEGEIKYKGGDIKNYFYEISYVPQKFEFDKTVPITVDEFLNLTKFKITEEEKNHILKETGVYSYLYKKLGEISGGELQRVLIAKALIDKPKLLLMDEPLAGIDIEGAKKFANLLEHLYYQHEICIILVSHELSIIHHLANKILCLNKKMLCYGDIENVLTLETLKALYGEEYKYKPHHH